MGQQENNFWRGAARALSEAVLLGAMCLFAACWGYNGHTGLAMLGYAGVVVSVVAMAMLRGVASVRGVALGVAGIAVAGVLLAMGRPWWLAGLAVVGGVFGALAWRDGNVDEAALPVAWGGIAIAVLGVFAFLGVLHRRAQWSPSGLVVAQVLSGCPEGMVFVPEGTFLMGSPPGVGEEDEHPQHSVRVSAFCIDRTEVTVARYRACVMGRACTAAGTTVSWLNVTSEAHQRWDTWCNWRFNDREEHPINCVDWVQADTYCHSSGGRLPTEAEWEYAARGSQGRTYPWGEAAPDQTRGNFCGPECARAQPGYPAMPGVADDGFPETAPVGRFPAGVSPFGALDMAGNVLEWVADVYSSDAYSHPRAEGFIAREASDASQTTEYRVFRGGGLVVVVASGMRTAKRNTNVPTYRDIELGFRCARGAR